jgi:adenosylmethionine-8-amino-7-oxononanoate aminotransferase
MIAELVMDAGGVIVPPPSYFPRLRQICDCHDVLLIADEVNTGFGRTGRWFALGHWDVEPDLVSSAEGCHQRLSPSRRRHGVEAHAPGDRRRADGRRFMHAATHSA